MPLGELVLEFREGGGIFIFCLCSLDSTCRCDIVGKDLMEDHRCLYSISLNLLREKVSIHMLTAQNGVQKNAAKRRPMPSK